MSKYESIGFWSISDIAMNITKNTNEFETTCDEKDDTAAKSTQELVDMPEAVQSAASKVSITWSVEDIIGDENVDGIRPDLSHNQAMRVLEQAVAQHDANVGITWSVLESIAAKLYPKK